MESGAKGSSQARWQGEGALCRQQAKHARPAKSWQGGRVACDAAERVSLGGHEGLAARAVMGAHGVGARGEANVAVAL